jgi:hypothetical protein
MIHIGFGTMNIRFGFGTDPNFKVIIKGIRIAIGTVVMRGGGDRSHRPGKGESSEGEHPVNKDNVEQPKGLQPRVEIDRSKEAPPQAEVEKPKEQPPKPEVDKPKAEEKARTEKPQAEEKSKTEKPKPEQKKDDSKAKGE